MFINPIFSVDKNQQKIVNTHIISLSKMENSNNSLSMKNDIEESQQDEIVLFKFKRAYREESFDQIKIHSKKVKPNPESTQKAIEEYKKRHFVDRETMLTEMFQKLQLRNTQTQSVQKTNKTQQQQHKPSYFLKRINLPQPSSSQLTTNEQVQIQATRIRTETRKQSLQQRLNRNRGIVQAQKKRVKYKIIDIRQQNFVQLNGQKVEYEDLSKEYSQEERERCGAVYDYYILKKGMVAGTTAGYQPSIILPSEAQYLLQQQQNQLMNQQSPAHSSSDSNRSDRSDYDYPQQDYHQGDSDDDSEGIIEGRNRGGDYDDQDDQDDDLRNDYKQQDEEEYYRQYLRRCRRKEKGDDEITYLYNMKPAKYDNDSEQQY